MPSHPLSSTECLLLMEFTGICHNVFKFRIVIPYFFVKCWKLVLHQILTVPKFLSPFSISQFLKTSGGIQRRLSVYCSKFDELQIFLFNSQMRSFLEWSRPSFYWTVFNFPFCPASFSHKKRKYEKSQFTSFCGTKKFVSYANGHLGIV